MEGHHKKNQGNAKMNHRNIFGIIAHKMAIKIDFIVIVLNFAIHEMISNTKQLP
jgi:hypothetical protein